MQIFLVSFTWCSWYKCTYYKHGMLQFYPPYKNLDPEIPR
jgi:hypothetical protein